MPAAYWTDPQTEEWVFAQIKAWADDHNGIGPSVRKAAEICNIPQTSMQRIYTRLQERRLLKPAPYGGVIVCADG